MPQLLTSESVPQVFLQTLNIAISLLADTGTLYEACNDISLAAVAVDAETHVILRTDHNDTHPELHQGAVDSTDHIKRDDVLDGVPFCLENGSDTKIDAFDFDAVEALSEKQDARIAKEVSRSDLRRKVMKLDSIVTGTTA